MEIAGRPKTAIFGGTFDPIHMGHVELLENVYEEICPDRIVIIPSGHPYMKEKKGIRITSSEDRIGMLEAGVGDLDLPIVISRIETGKDTPSYSVDTIAQLKAEDLETDEKYADGDYYFLCGSDILFEIEKWYEFEKLLGEIILTVTPRGEDDIGLILEKKKDLEEKYAAKIIITSFRGRVVSSTLIRSNPDKYKDLIPEGTYEYIKEHHLYERKD
ncbi:MAG: nicotinate (nicotinamide) nucleotide adenylyltransferase [Lachnospiraceae bacterium]|nr:nicotinate (nicotinamide) nucleotide adenylyltransferase [Lachnospiraceae bacterium]